MNERSLSFKNILSPAKNLSQNAVSYKKPQPTPSKRRPSKLWQETVEGNVSNVFSEMQIKRQNAIFELYEGENDLVHDLQMIKETYYNSLKTLGLMTESELHQIFSVIETLVPIHQDLVMSLISQRQPDGSTEGVGEVLLDWLPNLHSYIPYCANQIYAKALLDEKKNDKRIHDFLQRCQESSFSRKLDLWTFLDLPRNRLVKYPLLLKNIQKRTPESHADIQRLQQAIDSVEAIIREVDEKAGEAKCNFHRDRLDFLEESQRHPLIDEAKVLLCDGVLRNSRGTKLTVFVFKKVMVLTRPTTRHDRQCYQVYRYPLPLSELIVEDLKDGEVKMGSFRNMLGQGQGSKYVFRVSSTIQSGKGYTHTLQARDEHDKKQWLNCLQLAIKEAMPVAAKMATPKTDVNDVVEDDTEEQKMDMSFVNDAIDLDESCLPMEDSCLPMENDQGGDCRLKRSDSRSSQKSLHSEVMEAVNVVSERRRSLRSSTKSLASALKRSLSNRSVRSSVSSLPHGEQAEGESVFEKSSDSSSSSEMDPLDFSKSKKV
ncbi:rho guanine nucleotide exchange factor 3-like isoform X2 [Lineus longissimus]|uniref:rho guanine nucleotide exchange factor 3-like isoform X2 n=1 Tax=Lineus longissimus TaxID=88925 RepID=UPI002B4D0413